MAGRLLSENKGIESLVRNVISNGKIRTIILCGNDAVGHKAGHSLLLLHQNGIDAFGRIIGSSSPNPILSLTNSEVSQFQNSTRIVNKIGKASISILSSVILDETQYPSICLCLLIWCFFWYSFSMSSGVMLSSSDA